MALAARAHPDARSFRDALGRFATGVALITAAPDGDPFGLIVNSLASVSLEPPLVSFSPSRSSLTWARMRRAGRFGVNVLGSDHEEFAIRATPADADRFAGLDWELGRGGVPLLTDALASLECEIVAEHPAGDHWIVVGRVDGLHVSPVDEPLVFFAGAFGALQSRRQDHGGRHRRSVPMKEGSPAEVSTTLAVDEEQASAGARSAPASLLHPRQQPDRQCCAHAEQPIQKRCEGAPVVERFPSAIDAGTVTAQAGP